MESDRYSINAFIKYQSCTRNDAKELRYKIKQETDQTLFNDYSKTSTIFSKCAMSNSQSES